MVGAKHKDRAHASFQVCASIDSTMEGMLMSLARAQEEYDNRTPPEEEDYCGECKQTKCVCDEIDRSDEMYDRWKDEVKR